MTSSATKLWAPSSQCHMATQLRGVVGRSLHEGTTTSTAAVHFSSLNKLCQHETFPIESTFQFACRIPKDIWKTVTDACNAYYSVLLRVSDRHLTSLVAQFGG